MGVYSFQDVQCSISGPNGSFNIGSGAGIAEEGITITYEGDKGTCVWGADGTPMHSLHAARGGTVSIRVQKTAPVNAQLNALYRADTSSAAVYGQNTITVRNPTRGDVIVASACGQRKMPDNVNAKEGGIMDWAFNAGFLDEILGDGTPISAFILAGNG
jgi:Protein of unknown function (DUF3277)